jgi:TRAP-type C4-dicarboxylate transport system permease small subunit
MTISHTRNRSWPSKIEQALTRTESLLASTCLVSMLILSLLEIGARNFFHSGIPGASTLIQYLVLWVCFLGAVVAVRERHIKIDVATHLLSETWRNKLERPIFIFCTLVCGTLFWYAVRFWHDEWLSVPSDEKWVAAMGIIFPVSFCLLSLHFALRVIIGPRTSRRAT